MGEDQPCRHRRIAQDAGSARVLKQLIITADDFGRSPEINAAIARAWRAGFLTQASLMVNEPAVADAVALAGQCPGLCVGLHLTLCAGQATGVSALTDPWSNFTATPARAGWRYFVSPALAGPLREEIRAQFARFRALGFAATYWDGHAHLHLHPTVLRLTLPIAAESGFRFMRLVREPGPPAPLPLIFQMLSRAAIPHLAKHSIHFADHLFGLRDTGKVRTETIARYLKNLPAGVSELYFHPGAEPEEIDYAALVPLFARYGITPRTSRPFAG
jgi:hopanoid biosynthesis associated protein HpnK